MLNLYILNTPLAAAQELYEICTMEEDELKITPLSVIIIGMYFAGIIQTEKQEILRRLHRVMFKVKGLSVELLVNCYQTNRLNELTHKKFEHKQSITYQRYCNEIRHLHPLCLDPLEEPEYLEILSDDHCPVCNMKGFYSQNRNLSNKCSECYNIMCISCYGQCNKCFKCCLLYTSPSPRDLSTSRMPSSA